MSTIPNSNSCAGTFGSSPTNPGMDYLTTKPREVNLVNFRKVAECYQESFTLKRQRQEGLVYPESPSLNVQFEGVRLGDVCNSSYFDSFPVGYRFCPTDQELIVDYLKKKVMDEELPRHKFKHINIYKYSPEELAAMFKGNREKEFYFFTPRDKKYPKGNRPNRAAGGGYWKATGADKKIKFNGKEVGSKKSLVFYRGKPPHGDKTNWIMQEYRVNDPPPCKRDENDMRLDEWVLCKIYKKVDKSLKEKSKQKSRSFRHENNTDAAVPDTVESDIEDDQKTPRCNAGAEDYQAWKPSRFNAEAQDCQAFKLSGFNAAGPADYQAFKPLGCNAVGPADYQAFKPSGCNAAGPADYQAFKPSGCNAAGPADYQAFKPSGCNAPGPVAYQAFKPSGSNAAPPVDYQAFKPSRFGPADYQASKPVPHFNAEAGAHDAEEFQALNFTYGADAEALNSSYWTSPEMEIGEPPLYLTNEDNWEKIFSSENPENSQSLNGKPCRP